MSETVCYFQSGIGNLVMATPAMQAMASLDQTGKTDVLLDGRYRKDHRFRAVMEILSHSPYIERVVFHGEQNGDYRRFFVPVQSETSDGGHWVHRQTPRPQHWPGARWHHDQVHEIEANMRFVRLHGYEGKTPRQYVPVADWPVLSGPRPWIGLCNSSFGTSVWEKKKWEWFPEAARALAGRFKGSIFGVGGPGDLIEVGNAAVLFCGRTTIMETAKILSQLDLFVTTDTGCMHIADALDVPLVGLFGGTLPSKNAPVGKRSWFIRSNLVCAPCQYQSRFYSCRDYQCMRQIRPEKVMEAAEIILSERRGEWDCS